MPVHSSAFALCLLFQVDYLNASQTLTTHLRYSVAHVSHCQALLVFLLPVYAFFELQCCQELLPGCHCCHSASQIFSGQFCLALPLPLEAYSILGLYLFGMSDMLTWFFGREESCGHGRHVKHGFGPKSCYVSPWVPTQIGYLALWSLCCSAPSSFVWLILFFSSSFSSCHNCGSTLLSCILDLDVFIVLCKLLIDKACQVSLASALLCFCFVLVVPFKSMVT